MGFLSKKSGKQPRGQDTNQASIEADSFVFDVEKIQHDELAQCRVGDYVNVWVPKDDLRKVYVFRRGSVGGIGRIGYVPSKHSRLIATHLSNRLKYETEIIEINLKKSLCKIKCRLVSKGETLAREAERAKSASDNLKTELQKKVYP